MTALRIIGVGSPFGADTVGWEVTDDLQSLHADRTDLEFLHLDRPGTALLTQLEGTDDALILDAMRAGLAPGSVRALTPEMLSTESPLLSSHGLGVAQALALGKSLGRLPLKLTVIGIEIGEGTAPFDPDEVERIAGIIARDHL